MLLSTNMNYVNTVRDFWFCFCLSFFLVLFYPVRLKSGDWGEEAGLLKAADANYEGKPYNRKKGGRYCKDYVFRFQHTNAEQQKISRGPKVKYSMNFLSGCAP